MATNVRCAALHQPATHQQIVDHYIRCKRPDLLSELQWFKEQPTFSGAVEEAVRARSKLGQRLSHQRRLLTTVIPASIPVVLGSLPKLQQAKNFDEVFSLLSLVLQKVYGAGDLYIYDTALRIGAPMDLLPEQVYLQAGAAAGASKLLGRRVPRLLPLSKFPATFQRLQAYELENLLCCYRSYF
ncbi:MAG: hypothetical protein EON50_20180 [Acidovorax sp.]|nr:MAG: hypothetical protein EON50_20180 [Acidovorax sp.]